MERPLLFKSGSEHLVGTLNVPEAVVSGQPPEVGIIFAQSGARGRLGNTFHYPFMARRFAQAGIPSLRFDPAGLGDSTGTIPRYDMREFYGKISVGYFVNDLLTAIEEFKKYVSPKHIVLAGVCGGAVTALLAAPRSPNVDGLILMSVPVLLASAQTGDLDRIPKGYARDYLIKAYGRKLLSPKAWKRLLLGQSEVPLILNYLRAALKLDHKKPKKTEPLSKHPNPLFNEHFVESMDALVSRGSRLLLLFGEDDAFRHEWESEFYNLYWHRRPEYESQTEILYIPACNHMFTLREWQNKAVDKSLTWAKGF